MRTDVVPYKKTDTADNNKKHYNAVDVNVIAVRRKRRKPTANAH